MVTPANERDSKTGVSVVTEQEDFEETYHKRYIFERKIAELFFRHGMRRARFFGKRKIEFQMICKALAVNIKRLPKLLGDVPGVCLEKAKDVLGTGNNEKKATSSTV
ncbi:Transposase DDE domain-containing protein [Halarsenatibacter silvermanii]|uniref:Transposase DDE domain-containing protein n=2 Tax=Halarsenatibacter silvermanii TaxID=321763 RepID=A0A1G9LVP3_9FIRM|nr:Transposase DDE domain-containing protein [Halarsenatibacter silvermanii]